jgi:ABC-type nickel/cobalt efflux system permease component RcnA
MLILGLLLVVLSAAAAALLVAYNSSGGPEQMIVLFGRDLVSVTPLQAFLAGIGLALIFFLGLWMVIATERRRRAARSHYRDARREARAAAKERDELADQLAKERSAGTGTSWTPPAEPEPARPAETTTPPRRGIGRHFRRGTGEPADRGVVSSQPNRDRNG